MNKLDMKLYDVLPIAYDDSLSYHEAVQSIVNYINKLIEEGSKKYDDIINEIESELQNLKSDVNENLKEQTDKRTDDVNKADGSITAEVSDRKLADDRFIQLIEAALKNVKSYYSRGFILIGNSLTKDGKAWCDYVKDAIEGMYQVGVSYSRNSGFNSSNTEGNIGGEYRAALKSITVPERITDVVILTGNGELDTDILANMLGEFSLVVKENTPNASIYYGYFGKTVYPNPIAEAYESINASSFYVPCHYLADSRYLTGNIDFWNSEKTYLTSKGCDRINPYILQLVLDGHVSYNFTRSVTADLPATYFSGSSDYEFSSLSNSLTVDESYTEDGYRFTVSASTSFVDGNSETQGPVVVYPTPASVDNIQLIDTKDTNADPNFTIPIRHASFYSKDGRGATYNPGVLYIDSDGVLKVKIIGSTTDFRTNGIGSFIV